MRKRFVFVVLVPIVVAVIIVAMFLDSWVESGLEYAAEQVVGARVEIDGMDVSFSPVGLGWDRLQVTDPSDTWSNLFETGSVQFAMDAGQLLRAKFIIETITIDRFILGTKRETDGALTVEQPDPNQGSAGQTSFAEEASEVISAGETSAPVFDLGAVRAQLNLDSLLNPANLETYRLVDSLERQLDAAEGQWQATLSEMNGTRETVSGIESRVRSIDVKAINSVESAQKAFTAAREAYDQTQGVIGSLEQRKESLTQSINGFSSSIRSIDGAAQRDFDRVISAAKLPDVSMRGLAELVLGTEILSRAEEYLGYVDMARNAIPASTSDGDDDAPKGHDGVTIHFPEESSYPKLWIKEIVLSGGTDSTLDPSYFFATGTVTNISSDQTLTGSPLEADIEARNGANVRATFEATFDRLTDLPRDTYSVSVAGISVGDMPLGSQSFLPSRLTGANASVAIRLDVPGSDLESSSRISFSGVQIAFDRDPSNAVERLTRDVLAGIASFFVELRLWKTDDGALDLAFSTDLDNRLSGRARQVIGGEVARIRNDIRQQVDAQISSKRREIQALYDQKRSAAESQLRSVEQDIRTKIAYVEGKKKELEDRIEQEKKKAEEALKKKAGDALKGIFRKNG